MPPHTDPTAHALLSAVLDTHPGCRTSPEAADCIDHDYLNHDGTLTYAGQCYLMAYLEERGIL